MFKQLSFDGFEAGGKIRRPPKPRAKPAFSGEDHGFFLAVRPDLQALSDFERIGEGLLREHGLKTPLRPSELFHVTLFPLGRFDSLDEDTNHIIEQVIEASQDFAYPAFQVRFDGAMTFGRGGKPKPLVAVGGEGLTALCLFQKALGDRLTGRGLALPQGMRFEPHLTLLYDAQVVGEQRIEPVSWTVSEFFLIHSRRGKSRHDVIGQWPLGTAAEGA